MDARVPGKAIASYRPICNEAALSKTHQVAQAIRLLSNAGIAVVGFRFAGGAPEIELMPCRKLNAWIESGKATYNVHGIDGGQRYRQGIASVNGCRAVWTETPTC